MNCLCCGKALRTENPSGWHTSCIRRFFDTNRIPEIVLDDETLAELATRNASRGYTVPGVQKKLSLHLSDEQEPRLTIVNHPTGYILKPQVQEFRALPEAEQLAMSMADIAGIATVPHALVRVDGTLAYLTRRIDRVFVKGKDPQMLAMEDFCQLDLRLTQDKYKGSYERCTKVITRYSSRSGLDLTELFVRVVFSFIIGNSDMHLKNFSLIETAPGSGQYILSPAYDLLPVNVIMPEDQEQLALALNGKKSNLRRKDFLVFAEHINLPQQAAEGMLQHLISLAPKLQQMCVSSLLPADMKAALSQLIAQRSEQLVGRFMA